MQLMTGTNGEYVIISHDRISVCKRKHRRFEGSLEESVTTFPLSSLDRVTLIEPKFIFELGELVLLFDSDDNVFRSYTIKFYWFQRDRAARLFRTLSRNVEFT